MRLVGQLVNLRPLRLEERLLFFRWATRSDATPHWYGNWYGEEIPTYVIFKLDWPDHYFTDEKPERGRCYGIERHGNLIGEINYNEIDPHTQFATMDILISNRSHMGKGYGTEAIQLLSRYLLEELAVRVCQIEVIASNHRAIRAHKKAGFLPAHSFYRGAHKWTILEYRATTLEKVAVN